MCPSTRDPVYKASSNISKIIGQCSLATSSAVMLSAELIFCPTGSPSW